MTANDDISNYREVTEAEKTAIEESDAKWVRPPRAFVDRFNTAAGDDGGYNETTGFFELNGIKDIGYAEALRIMDVSTWPKINTGGTYLSNQKLNIRTAFPLMTPLVDSYSLKCFAQNCETIEVIKITEGIYSKCSNLTYAFNSCYKLRRVLGRIRLNILSKGNIDGPFLLCKVLEEIRISGLAFSLSFVSCPLLSLASIDYMIKNAANTGAITLTFHPDVYAKLTGDTTNAAAAALTEDELAQWMAIMVTAGEKGIVFAAA